VCPLLSKYQPCPVNASEQPEEAQWKGLCNAFKFARYTDSDGNYIH
jgi:hypothetical protein